MKAAERGEDVEPHQVQEPGGFDAKIRCFHTKKKIMS